MDLGRRRSGQIAAIIALLLLLAILATARGADARLYPAKRDDSVAIFLVDSGVAGAERGTSDKTRAAARKRRPG